MASRETRQHASLDRQLCPRESVHDNTPKSHEIGQQQDTSNLSHSITSPTKHWVDVCAIPWQGRRHEFVSMGVRLKVGFPLPIPGGRLQVWASLLGPDYMFGFICTVVADVCVLFDILLCWAGGLQCIPRASFIGKVPTIGLGLSCDERASAIHVLRRTGSH